MPASYPGQPQGSFGRFRIVRELGRGGFGVVFLADDPSLGRQVALKVPRPEAVADPALRERFLRKARAAAGLDHPNVVPVYEAGQVGAVCYIVSAYCPGPTLAAWLRQQGGPVTPRRAAALIACLADGAQHAHAKGIFHRDLKPANVLLQEERTTKHTKDTKEERQENQGIEESSSSFRVFRVFRGDALLPPITDFGLAKLLEADTRHTTTGDLIGTPSYMAPEQAEGNNRATGAATDIHALGVILYELLTGRLPFLGSTPLDTLAQVANVEPVGPGNCSPRRRGSGDDLSEMFRARSRASVMPRRSSWRRIYSDSRRANPSGPGRLGRSARLPLVPPQSASGGVAGTVAVLLVVIAAGSSLGVLWLKSDATIASPSAGRCGPRRRIQDLSGRA